MCVGKAGIMHKVATFRDGILKQDKFYSFEFLLPNSSFFNGSQVLNICYTNFEL